MNISVNAPSYKRPGGVLTLGYIPWCRVWVCESEADAYRAANPGAEIVPVPVGVQGNLCRIRNWILDREFERGMDAVCLIDDDLFNLEYWESPGHCKVDPEDIPAFIEKYTVLADEWGVKLWGININRDRQCYREFTPFSTLSYIGGPFSVHLPNPLRYDERLPLKEDYDMTLQHLNRYRGVLRVNKFFYNVKQGACGTAGGQTGGCAVYRNVRREREQLKLLQTKWGTRIVQTDTQERNHRTKKRKGIPDLNPVIRVPIAGI